MCFLILRIEKLRKGTLTMSEKAIAIKAQHVDEIAQLFTDSASSIVADVRGLTVAQADALRSSLREEGVTLKVIKNKVLTRAAEKAGFGDLNDVFVGPSAIAFSKDDAIAPARILKEYSTKIEALEVKGGVVDGKVASLEEVNKYASLPSREGLLSQLLAEFQYPLRSFMYAVKAVSEKRVADGEVAPEVEAPAAETEEKEEAPVATEEVVADAPVEEAPAAEATEEETKEESAE
jgi:large subunit ribosomal protein L10